MVAAAAALGAAFRGVGDAFVGGVPGALGGGVFSPGLAAGGAAGVVAIKQLADELREEPEPLSFDPTARTIRKVLEPRGVSYVVVINNWDPRDGTHDLNETKEFAKANGWPLAHTVIRHYKLHTRASADGLVVTEYPANRVALQAREDFYRLALELNVGGR